MRKTTRFSAFMSLVTGALMIAAVQFGGASGCGGGASGGGGGGGGGGLGGATTVTGTALAANGTDPIAGATVFIPGTAVASLGTGKTIVNATCSGETVSCDDPPEASCASVCTCADGTYTLDVTTCPDDSTTIRYCKGSFCGSATLDCAADSASCTANITGSTTAGSTARIAVVTGAYDEMENVLAKLGFGTVYPEGSTDGTPGELQIGTESFAIYKCGGVRDSEYLTADADESEYKPCSTLFGSLTEMQQYDIIFIDCGANEDTDLSFLILGQGEGAAHKASTKKVSTDVASRVRSYVEGGGVLYVTDLAYDYVEQSIPEFMDFNDDGDGDSATAEDQNAAQDGVSGIVSDATVTNGTMSTWLEGRSSNTIDAALSPNSGSCDTTENGNSDSLLDAATDTIRIGDFLPSWGVMKETYAGDSNTFVWIQGPVDFSGENDVTRPLTASRQVGSGCVLYSSYHTSHSCPTTGFWPQERVLQYLIFETEGACTP